MHKVTKQKNQLGLDLKIKQADQYMRQQSMLQAIELYQEISVLDSDHAYVWFRLAEANRKLGHFNEAEIAARKAVELSPQDPSVQFELAAALHCLNRTREALPHYRLALDVSPDMLEALFLFSKALIYHGETQEAYERLQHAVRLKPNFMPALCSLAGLTAQRGELVEARVMLNRVLALRADYIEALCHLAYVEIREGKTETALTLYRRALKSHPLTDEALAGYTSLLEQCGRLEEAEPELRAGLERAPQHPRLNLAMGRLDRRAKRWDTAVAHLQIALDNAPSPALASSAHMLLGQALDQQERTEKAYAHFEAGNALSAIAAGMHDLPAVQNAYLAQVEHISNVLTPLWRTTDGFEENELAPVFLIGFPRSGTTLLERILDAHPALQTVEERGMVQCMYQALVSMSGGDENSLPPRLDDAQCGHLREVYFEELRKHIEVRPGARVVDKLPLNTALVPLIWRVFPEAKFILAIRHPFDASLSCFMQDFELNPAMSNFVTLDATVNLYCKVMGLWEKSVAALPLSYHRIRYEDVVEDFEGEIRQLLGFLELPWDDAILNYRESSKSRLVQTPSYHQVAQPIYQSAKYRWERYAAHFEKHKERMAPFLSLFGYESRIDNLADGP